MSAKFVKMMRLDGLWPFYGMVKFVSPVAVAILEDCCMAFANMQVSKLWPMASRFRLSLCTP